MRWGRPLPGIAGAVLALVASPCASAHEPGGARSGYVSSVTDIRPSILGLQAVVLGAQDRLLVRNWSGKVVVILGHDRRPLFRLDQRRVFQFDGSGWRRLQDGSSVAWHDRRIGWFDSMPPQVVRSAPDTPHFIRAWRVAGTAGGRPFVIRGLLGYSPPPAGKDGRGWLLPVGLGAGGAALALAGGVGARRLRRRAP